MLFDYVGRRIQHRYYFIDKEIVSCFGPLVKSDSDAHRKCAQFHFDHLLGIGAEKSWVVVVLNSEDIVPRDFANRFN